MPLTVEQFTQRLTSSGVMSDDELRDWIAAAPIEKRPNDGEALARELVKQKKLTKFQAEQIYAGKEKSLTLGNYLLLDKLGQGGMGMVLKARHKRMARVVALKVMSPAAVKSADAVKRFHREVQTAAKLTHPNIVTAFDADEAKGTHFLVMEYVEGDDLSQLVKKHGPLSVEQAIECIIQAARGLTHAHAEGVI
ncbi:MAG: serine/threonine protein kinase, partial [Planctomycetaceae bacterium]|nr:serine/threonine protein kinase [Planctomycetaceae bacterium]